MFINIHIETQSLILSLNADKTLRYSVSTAKHGVGQLYGSNQTPLGRHIIRAKIGEGVPINTVFIGRRQTGDIYSSELAKDNLKHQDWILTRILWLSGLDKGLNRHGCVDTMRRYIYIHGTPDSEVMGKPLSHGCIRMRNSDIIDLFQRVVIGTRVDISLT